MVKAEKHSYASAVEFDELFGDDPASVGGDLDGEDMFTLDGLVKRHSHARKAWDRDVVVSGGEPSSRPRVNLNRHACVFGERIHQHQFGLRALFGGGVRNPPASRRFGSAWRLCAVQRIADSMRDGGVTAENFDQHRRRVARHEVS